MGNYTDLLKAQEVKKPSPVNQPTDRLKKNQDSSKPENQFPRKPGNQEPRKPVSPKTGIPGNQEIRKSTIQNTGKPANQDASSFDLNIEPDHKITFLITDEEFFSLEDLKITLKRDLGKKAKWDDLARCAFNLLLTDYRTNKEQNFLVRHLKQKATK